MKKIKLGDITSKIGSGATPRGGKNIYEKKGIAFIRSQNVRDFYFDYNQLAFINDNQASQLSNVEVKLNDILLNITGDSITRCTLSPKDILPARVSQHVAIIRCHKNINSKFIMYNLLYMKNYLLSICKIGGTRNALTKEMLSNLPIDLPPKETQDKIAALLGALDDKIALNKKINATLESMAKTLYDYWFVQFDFPDENGKPYKTSGGKMIYSSELGRDISAGWEVGTLENFGTLKNGINYDKNTIGDCRVKIVNVKDISNSTFSIATESLDDINLPEEQTRKYLTTTKDILIARSGIPGAVRTLADENFHSIYCGFIICFQPQNKLWKNFMTFTLQKHYEIISTQSAGTIMQNITQDTLKNFRLIVPPLSVLEKFNRVVEPMIFKINKNILESRRLAALRDWLLPMLMNGQIKFKET